MQSDAEKLSSRGHTGSELGTHWVAREHLLTWSDHTEGRIRHLYAQLTEQDPQDNWKLSKMHNDPRNTRGFQNYAYVSIRYKFMQVANESHTKAG